MKISKTLFFLEKMLYRRRRDCESLLVGMNENKMNTYCSCKLQTNIITIELQTSVRSYDPFLPRTAVPNCNDLPDKTSTNLGYTKTKRSETGN